MDTNVTDNNNNNNTIGADQREWGTRKLAQVDTGLFVEQKILYVLTIYPRISLSMLQIGVGPQVSRDVWRPILERLIKEKRITREHLNAMGPSGRNNMHTIYSLANHE